MPRIFVFTAGQPSARAHLDDSIRNPIPSDTVYRLTPPERHEELRRIEAEAGGFYAWGAEPGERNIPTWNLMERGDYVLCVYENAYRYGARVLGTLHNETLAEEVWGRNPDSRNTWEYMYLLSKPVGLGVHVNDLADDLQGRYFGFVAIADPRLTAIRDKYGGVDQFVSSKLAPLPMPSRELDDFLSVMRIYHEEGTVFQSVIQGQRYRIESVDDTGAVVARIDANEPERVTVSSYRSAVERARDAGGTLPFSELANTVAIRTTLTQGDSLGLAPDRKTVRYLGTADTAEAALREVLENLHVDQSGGEPRLYKPALLAAVIEGIAAGDLKENKIAFDWVVPRTLEKLGSLGIQVSEQQVAYAFFHLTGDLFWLLSYSDPTQPISGVPTPEGIRESVSHASLRNGFWKVLGQPEACSRVLAALEARWFTSVWWVNQGQSYRKERDGGYLWAPVRNKKGQTNQHRTNVTKTKPRDVVVHYADGIRAISCVAAEPHPAERPGELPDNLWERDGNIVSTEYFELEEPIALNEIPPDLRSADAGPFTRDGAVKQGYLFPLDSATARGIAKTFADRWPEGSPWAGATTMPTLEDLAAELFVDAAWLRKIQRLLEHKRQIVFYGPPGTGKTFIARKLASYLARSDERVRIVQFHPAYSYEDFVEGYRPVEGDQQIGFRLVDGPLKEMAEAARDNPSHTHVLLIDEINRGNLPKVLGELYFLLEYRNESINLLYSAKPFRLPENLWIISTMNTADRSIALVDAALRRRFHFFPFFPQDPPISQVLKRWLQAKNPELSWVADVVDRANEELGERHGAIGPAHFLREDLDEEWVTLIWNHSVIPYLEEQFFGEEERVDDFKLERLRRKREQEAEDEGDADN